MAKQKGKTDNRFTYIIGAVLVVGIGLIVLLSRLSGGGAPPVSVTEGEINTATGFAIGSADAPITIVEWSDYQCPYCAQAATEAFPQLREKYIDTGQVRYIAKDFPLSGHPQSNPVAEYVNCAINQDEEMYWALRELVFGRQREWSGTRNFLDRIRAYAAEVGLDGDAMESCFRAATMREQIQVTRREGLAMNITGTPALFVNGQQVGGYVPWETLDAMLAEALADGGE